VQIGGGGASSFYLPFVFLPSSFLGARCVIHHGGESPCRGRIARKESAMTSGVCFETWVTVEVEPGALIAPDGAFR